MADGPNQDELARTATAPGATAGAPDAPALGTTLGRYRLERELGAGGMGVVHAAFDPDLERRVALKVLRVADGSGEARQRLLREARALARLTHPNVVTVHEVGSANGRDYVAMEMIDGDTLDDWLKAARRKPHDVIAAFTAAGRGLAAAHAAGLVHRDFKPHNVLRRKDGRIVVTDFGLARGVEAAIELEATMRLRGAKPVANQGLSPLSGLTETGSVMGTPAYMAPEQWSGDTVGPPADQFAFCVALWEALAGERPFRGATLEALSIAVSAGPDKLDDAKLPRRIRAPLKRGLHPDPAKRWPNMDALLAAITRAERRPGVALLIAGGAVLVAGGLFLALDTDEAGPTCELPIKDPATVWSPVQATLLRARGQTHAANMLDEDMRSWRAIRERTCKLEPGLVREARLACLDGVLARFDLAARTLAAVSQTRTHEPIDRLITPAVCENKRPPRLVRAISPELYALTVADLERGEAEEPVDKEYAAKLMQLAGSEPCALALAKAASTAPLTTYAERERVLEEAERDAQRCGDDHVTYSVAIVAATYAIATLQPQPVIEAKLKRVETLLEPIAQSDVEADLDMLRASAAVIAGNLDEGIKRIELAEKRYHQRGRIKSQIGARLVGLAFKQSRGARADVEAMTGELDRLREFAVRELGAADPVIRGIDEQRAKWRFDQGDVAGAQAALEALNRPEPIKGAIHVTGRVVDTAGRPVANATVAAGDNLAGNSVTVASPSANRRTTTTKPDGTFELTEVAPDGVAIAQLAELRSAPQRVAGEQRSAPQRVAGELTLVLEPTSRLEGTVDLKGEPAEAVTVLVRRTGAFARIGYSMSAPVRADGSFVLDGVPRARVLVQTARSRGTTQLISGVELDIKQPVVKNVRLELKKSQRAVHVLVRSTVGQPVANAQVFVVPGRRASTTVAAMESLLQTATAGVARPLQSEQAPPPVLAKSKRGDLYAKISDVAGGEISACAISLPSNIADEEMLKALRDPKNHERIAVPCVTLGATDDFAIVEVPPWPRFD